MSPSYFELQMRWLSSLTPVTYLCTLLGIHCVGSPRSPQSRTYVRSWGFTALPPSCSSNYFGDT
ncbi:hypothetical protein DTH24_09780 [Salmonella enterica subsp. enterica serovar Urbana]|nr:hypothetical protein [Salmonella enterica subsp. enterica serovar Urbana]